MGEPVDQSLLLILLIIGAIWLLVNELYGDKKVIVPFARKIVGLAGKVDWGDE